MSKLSALVETESNEKSRKKRFIFRQEKPCMLEAEYLKAVK